MRSKSIISWLLLLSGAVTACQESGSGLESDVKEVVFSIEDFKAVDECSDQVSTRTSIINKNEFIWSAGDTVGIYPNTGSQVYFAMTKGAGAKSAEFDGGGWDFKAGSTYYSYYPFIGDIYLDRHNIPVCYYGQTQDGTDGVEHIGAYDFMYTPGTSSVNSKLNFSYKHLNCIIRPKLTLPAGTYTKLAVTAPSYAFAARGHFDLQSSEPVIIPTEYSKQLTIDLDNVTVSEGTEFNVYLVSAPVNLGGIEITVSVLDDQKREYQCKKTPSVNYEAGMIGGLTCTSWTEVPQSMGLIIDGWDDGGSIGGDAE